MKKKFFNCVAVILCIVIMVSVITITSSAVTEGYFTYTIENGEVTINEVDTSIKGNIIIPSFLGGFPVTRIEDKAFYECSEIGSITIPNTIKYIGENAFWGCENIKKVFIDDLNAWLNIDYKCSFYAGYARRAIGPLHYGADLYVKDVLLEELVIPEGTKRINDIAFEGCSSISKVVLPEGIEEIGAYAFHGCKNLKEINIPDSMISFGTSAFSGTPSKKVVVNDLDAWFCMYFSTGHGENLPCGSNPLSGKSELYLNEELVTEVKLSSDIEYIHDCLFEDCISIKTVYIPKSVTEIGIGAFSRCENIENIYYEGTEQEWEMVNKSDYNYYFETSNYDWYFKIPIQYNSKTHDVFFNSDNAKMEGNIIIVVPDILGSELLVQAGTGAVIKDSKGKMLESDKCPGTGMSLIVADGNEYTIVVFGDVDGDAAISAADARLVLRASVGLEKFTEDSAYFKAANVEKGDSLTASDARLILRASVGLEDTKNWMR